MARIHLALFALAVAAAPLGAQQTTNAIPLAPTSLEARIEAPAPQAMRGPMLDGARVAVHMQESQALPSEMAAARMGLGQARALMIVGGGALLAGAIIGGDAGAIIMVGGAVIGLVGLYEYLQ